MSVPLILAIPQYLESFLNKWSAGMDRAGYLKYTTAKREDCISSFEAFITPLLEFSASYNLLPGFGEVLKDHRHWADRTVEIARRHRFRGITAEMFLGCFSTLVHAVCEVIREMDAPTEDRLETIQSIGEVGDAYSAVILADWTALSRDEEVRELVEANRRLTLEKNRYENLFAATSDMVLVTDADGCVVEANATARAVLGGRNVLGKWFWELLDLEGRNIHEVMHYYRMEDSHEISPFEDGSVFKLRLFPLKSVSLASRGYMVLLNNVSCLVGQRERLESVVNERTTALENTAKQYKSLFQAAGESILLVDTDFKVVGANRRSTDVFGLSREEFTGLPCSALCPTDTVVNLNNAIRNLDEGEIRQWEMVGRRASGTSFPMDVTINRVDLDSRTLFHVLVRDATQKKAMENNLRREKSQMEELNITLRNVMKTIDHERRDVQRAVAERIRELLLPAVDRIMHEGSAEVRKGYLEIIRDQLEKLAAGSAGETDARLLKLTPTEMKVCRFIQAGSTTKDIAEALSLSADTIQTHRKNIRKKLGIRGRQVNLYTYLLAHEPRDSGAAGSR